MEETIQTKEGLAHNQSLLENFINNNKIEITAFRKTYLDGDITEIDLKRYNEECTIYLDGMYYGINSCNDKPKNELEDLLQSEHLVFKPDFFESNYEKKEIYTIFFNYRLEKIIKSYAKNIKDDYNESLESYRKWDNQ